MSKRRFRFFKYFFNVIYLIIYLKLATAWHTCSGPHKVFIKSSEIYQDSSDGLKCLVVYDI